MCTVTPLISSGYITCFIVHFSAALMPAPVVVQTQPPVSYPAVSAPPPMHYAPPLQVSVEAFR